MGMLYFSEPGTCFPIWQKRFIVPDRIFRFIGFDRNDHLPKKKIRKNKDFNFYWGDVSVDLVIHLGLTHIHFTSSAWSGKSLVNSHQGP